MVVDRKNQKALLRNAANSSVVPTEFAAVLGGKFVT